MSAIFIYNPTAGEERAPVLEALCQEAENFGVTCFPTDRVAHATEIAQQSDARRILVAGGDDTVREVIAGLQKDASLGIIPTGTFNIFARSLGVSLEPLVAFRDALEGGDTLIDLATLDEFVFNESAGVGLVAEAFAHAPDQSVKGLARWWAGAQAAFTAVSDLHSESYHLLLDEKVDLTTDAIDISVANVGLIGAGVPWMPQADPRDGWLDVVVIPPRSRLELIADLPTLFDSERASGTTFRAKTITIRTQTPQPFRYDGYVTDDRDCVTIRCLPGALKVCNAHFSQSLSEET